MLTFAPVEKLIYRVSRILQKKEKLAILVGSGVTLPTSMHKGIASAGSIASMIGERFDDDEGRKMFQEETEGRNGSERYQKAMRLLIECMGQGAVNDVIAEAVLAACDVAPKDLNNGELVRLEEDYEAWNINPAVQGLACLYKAYPQLVGPILTSNFDPLIGIAIKKMQVDVEVSPLQADGRFFPFEVEKCTRRIVHFHGYWRGTDTLHTFDQITRDRPLLSGDLRRLLETHSLLVIGYGGWGDVFMNTLAKVISEGAKNNGILWGFYENDEADIQKNYSDIFRILGPEVGGRVVLYKGIDASIFFPAVCERLFIKVTDRAALASQNNSLTSLDRVSDSKSILAGRSMAFDKAPNCDPPPTPDRWIGRMEEMRALQSGAYKVAFITGIGGQGKSVLASAFLSGEKSDNAIEFWDWRDCREEKNHIHTNLVNLCHRLSNGALSPEELKSESDISLVENLFRLMGETRAIIVFDNVDKYIDLEDLSPNGALKILVNEALRRTHNARFVFTCRPNVRLVETNLLPLAISGLKDNECLELFKSYQTTLSEVQLQQLADKAMEKTEGHPFWLNVIAGQAQISLEKASSLLDELSARQASDLASASDVLADQILHAVWQTLNDRNRTLLKAMAEAVCEQSKDQLVKILHKELNYSSITKSLNRLRALNLIVMKSSARGVEFFDLHPLVRRFVRSRFSPEQRKRFIALFVAYFDGIIVGLKKRLGTRTPFSDFRNWSYKIELEINRGDARRALESLNEVSSELEDAGYLEEFIRLAALVLENLDWEESVASDLRHFDVQVCKLSDALSELGRYSEADCYLDRLDMCVRGGGVSVVNLCNARAYRYWHAEEFKSAIVHAQRGVGLKLGSGADIDVDVEFRLALALRDTRDVDLIQKALEIFLQGESLERIISPTSEDEKRLEGKRMPFFGNVGRCLQFLGRNEEAMICIRKALQIGSKDDHTTLNNRAYAYWWIGEILESNGDEAVAAHFYRYAEIRWSKTSPPKARKMNELIQRLGEKNSSLLQVFAKDELEIGAFCQPRL